MAVRQEDRQQSVEKLRELIKDIRIAMLTTITPQGQLRSRPMVTQQVEFDGDLWFITSDDTPKVDEAKADPHVNVSYVRTDKHLYISVTGTAQIVNDRDKVRELWHPMHKAWFDGPDDPKIRLLKVRVHEAEYWDGPDGPVAQLVGFVKAVTGGNADMGDNEKLKLK